MDRITDSATTGTPLGRISQPTFCSASIDAFPQTPQLRRHIKISPGTVQINPEAFGQRDIDTIDAAFNTRDIGRSSLL
jgi:hypothetical protein